MKLRDFFNSQRRNAIVQELKKDFNPILEKVTIPVKAYAKENPGKTFALMIMVLIMNIMILFLFEDAFNARKRMKTTYLKMQDFRYSRHRGAAPEITPSFENIKKIGLLKDSLAYLMALKNLTFLDTLIFVRVMYEFQRISSGTSGIPPLKLEDLRKVTQLDKTTRDTTIK